MRWRLEDAEQTHAAGQLLAAELLPGDVIGLIGDLGAGKTCLVQGLMAGLYLRDGQSPEEGVQQVSSPTYTLMQHYHAPGGFDPVLHVDLYRLESDDDLESTGYWDATDEAGLVIVEWVDNIPGAWPKAGFAFYMEHDGEGRALSLVWRGGWEKAEPSQRLSVMEEKLSVMFG